MANPSIEIINAIRNTARRLASSEDYQWGHMGSCNCGFLVQEVTHLKKDEIHSQAMEKYGDWNEQLNDYCPRTGFKIDNIISSMLDFGFDIDDLKHLERLSDPKVLHTLPLNERNLKNNVKVDVVKYLNQWLRILEDQYVTKINIDNIHDALITQEASKKEHSL
ncbi:hypothetical protein [Chryseosolibacter indicus]|uniref:Uncharacterized protein n=1 Tax=Chryseosolibacter indicus TaxID=2782351 RepID=A0ABS5VTF3_9BACT|nr:hypothetical protein [Chryseosolibacter indicus]MBT1703261.1 hypothetical protein [Chryseosolibacter indicus]